MDSYTIIVFIFGVFTLSLLIIVFYINKLLNYKRLIKNSLIAVYAHIEARIDLIEEMKEFIEKNLEHEKSYLLRLQKIEDYLSEFLKKQPIFKNYDQNEKEFLHFTSLDKTYSKLKNNKGYQKLKSDALTNKDNLIYALDTYDKGVINYNNYKEQKIILIISKIFRFPHYDCYNK